MKPSIKSTPNQLKGAETPLSVPQQTDGENPAETQDADDPNENRAPALTGLDFHKQPYIFALFAGLALTVAARTARRMREYGEEP